MSSRGKECMRADLALYGSDSDQDMVAPSKNDSGMHGDKSKQTPVSNACASTATPGTNGDGDVESVQDSNHAG